MPETLQLMPKSEWPLEGLTEAWRSKHFLVLVFVKVNGAERLSVCRVNDAGRLQDGITWDDLQRLKRECGRGHRDAVEVYPADSDVVNVAPCRHLWVLDDPISFGGALASAVLTRAFRWDKDGQEA